MDYIRILNYYMKYKEMIKRARFLKPSESPVDEDCAIVSVDADIPPGAVAYVGYMTAILRLAGADVDTDHPLFKYLGERQEKGLDSEVVLTLSVSEREPQKKPADAGPPGWPGQPL